MLFLTSCTNPLSKISPGYFPPYRKRQEMTVEFGSEAALSPEPAERGRSSFRRWTVKTEDPETDVEPLRVYLDGSIFLLSTFSEDTCIPGCD